MTDTFISYGQNAEDVVLHRALGHLRTGRYVEVGANDPTVDSISRSFYNLGWSGLEIEPVPAFAQAFREERPRDIVAQVAVTAQDVDTVPIHVIDGTGLSTIEEAVGDRHARDGWPTRVEHVPARRLSDVVAENGFDTGDVHFAVVNVEGAERAVLESVDLRRWRPWVLVVEATAPLSNLPTHEEWEDLVLAGGYEFCLFDGVSRFYVAQEHAAVLRDALSRPASALDHYRRREEHDALMVARHADERIAALQAERDALTDDLVRWRGRALEEWAAALDEVENMPYGDAGTTREVARLKELLEATHATLSWRVTAPLRVFRGRQLSGRR